LLVGKELRIIICKNFSGMENSFSKLIAHKSSKLCGARSMFYFCLMNCFFFLKTFFFEGLFFARRGNDKPARL